MHYLRVWQSLFISLLLTTLVIGLSIAPRVKIDTNLNDISPSTELSKKTKFATDALRKNIEQRIILLISGSDEDSVANAEEQLRLKLEKIESIELQKRNDAFAEQLLDQLKPYRFSLSTPEQVERLKQLSPKTIADQALRALYGLSGQARVYSFSDDPLSWHSETFLSLLPVEAISDNHFANISLNIRSGALNMSTQKRLGDAIDTLSTQLSNEHAVDIDRSGIFFFAREAAQSSKKDISLISTGSTVGVVLLLLFVFRSFKALLLPVSSIAFGVAFAFVLSHLVYGQVHILTIVFGASLIGIVIDYSLHYFYHGASSSIANQPGNKSAPQGSEKSALFRALSLSLLTSIIGYAALSFSSLQALQKVALFSCCGLFMAWLSVICLGDLALRSPLKTEQRILPNAVLKLRNLCSFFPKVVVQCLVALVLIIGAYSALISKPFNDDPRVFFKPDSSLLESERKVASAVSDYEPGRYIILSGSSIDEVYSRYDQLQKIIVDETNLDPTQLTSLLNWVPSPKEQNKTYQSQSKLYQEGGAAQLLYQKLAKPNAVQAILEVYKNSAKTILTPSMASAMFANNIPPIWFEQDQSVINFVLIKKGVAADELEPLLDRVDGINYVNTLQATHTALTEQRISASKLLLLAYVLVALAMILRNKSLRAVGIVLVPLGATAMLFVIAFSFNFQLNLFHIMALFLVLGFGMDYGIFTNEMRDHSNVTLQAILLSALTSLLSFGLLSLSEIPVVASFGITLLIGNLFNLIGVFIYARLIQQTKPMNTTIQTTNYSNY